MTLTRSVESTNWLQRS